MTDEQLSDENLISNCIVLWESIYVEKRWTDEEFKAFHIFMEELKKRGYDYLPTIRFMKKEEMPEPKEIVEITKPIPEQVKRATVSLLQLAEDLKKKEGA